MAEKFRAQAAIESDFDSTACRLHGQAAIGWCSRATAGGLKAQAAMEYLVTYGWAILALLFVVAFLVSTGAFSASNFASQECTFQPDLPCSPFILYTSASGAVLSFNLTNGLGFPINITNVSYIATDMGSAGRQIYQAPDTDFPHNVIPSGGKVGISHTFSGAKQPQPRDFQTVLVSITYQNCRFNACAGNNYTTSGRISVVVEGESGGASPPLTDISPPSISQSANVNSGVVTISSSATDASGIASMRIYTATGVPAGHGTFALVKTCSSSPCSYTTGLGSGSYVYYVSATDASPNANQADSPVAAFVIP
ncbi:MAG: hypothetical protein QW568_00835 [Candidatus Anstonellaceae archaeon]